MWLSHCSPAVAAAPPALWSSCTPVFLFGLGVFASVWLRSAALLPAAESALPKEENAPSLSVCREITSSASVAPCQSVWIVLSWLSQTTYALLNTLFGAVLFALLKGFWHDGKLEWIQWGIFLLSFFSVHRSRKYQFVRLCENPHTQVIFNCWVP